MCLRTGKKRMQRGRAARLQHSLQQSCALDIFIERYPVNLLDHIGRTHLKQADFGQTDALISRALHGLLQAALMPVL
ncbi:hypothetical protein D3C78_1729830 [compost metagenome]